MKYYNVFNTTVLISPYLKLLFFAVLLYYLIFFGIYESLNKSFLVLIIYSSVFIHELGHCFFANLLDYRVKLLEIGIHGGSIELNKDCHIIGHHEFLITLGGPLTSAFLILFCYMINNNYYYLNCVILITIVLNLLNLLPMLPLDGGRLIRSFLFIVSNNLQFATDFCYIFGIIFGLVIAGFSVYFGWYLTFICFLLIIWFNISELKNNYKILNI